MDTNFIITAAVVVLIIGALAAAYSYGKLHEQVNHLREQLRQRHSDGQAKRHTHATAAGIEDAIATALDIQRTSAELQARAEQTLEILRTTREGPYSYDPDRPAGRRPDVKGIDWAKWNTRERDT